MGGNGKEEPEGEGELRVMMMGMAEAIWWGIIRGWRMEWWKKGIFGLVRRGLRMTGG